MTRLLALASLALLLATAPAHAAYPGSNGDLAVGARFGCDGFEIVTVDRHGEHRRSLTPSPCTDAGDGAYNAFPDWSADGTRLAFYDGDATPSFMTMAADGSDVRATGVSALGEPPRPYLPSHLRPSLAPDGANFAFTRAGGVWIAKLDGTGQRRLRTGIEPRFSPSGRRLAYVAVPRAGARELWVMDPSDGRRLRRLSRDAAEIDWAPDGRSIVFARPTHGSRRDLFIARADGRGIRRLTKTRDVDEGAPVFSPDGRFVAFTRARRTRGDVAYQLVGGRRQRKVLEIPALDSDTPFEASLSWGRRAG